MSEPRAPKLSQGTQRAGGFDLLTKQAERGLLSAILRWTPVVLILVFFALGLSQVRHASITFDEGPHLAVGYTTLRTGDLRLQPIHIHPPLANVVAAWPLLLQSDLPDPSTVEGWRSHSLSAVTDAVVWQYTTPARIAVAGRLPILLLGVVLCAIVTRWARDLGGPVTGTFALALCALDPNIVAHSALITTDIAAVTFSVATIYSFYRFSSVREVCPSRRRFLIVTGLLLGLAQLAKVSALMLVPVIGILLVIETRHRHNTAGHRLVRAVGNAVVLFGVAALVIWAGYGFEFAAVPGWTVAVPLVPSALDAIKLPAATHIRIFLSLREHYDLGHPTFALGLVSEHGWWWYFPAAFFVKTPLPTLLLLFGTGVSAIKRVILWVSHPRDRAAIQRQLTRNHLGTETSLVITELTLFPALYAISTLFSTVNIGYRHLLPLLPFLYISAASLLVHRQTRGRAHSRWASVAAGTLLAWLATSAVAVTPYPLTFFNLVVGGADQGYRYLVDSNLDWGQNLWDLADWMRAHDRDHVYYAHYSPADPHVYGIPADFLPPDPRAVDFAPWRPEPGLYAIGATVLQGPYAPDLNTFAWLRSHEPVAKLGHALFVYDVPRSTTPDWITLCGPHDADAIKRHLRAPDLRVVTVDCTQAEVYPPGTGRHLASTDLLSEPAPDNTVVFKGADGRPAATLRVASYSLPERSLNAGLTLDGPLELLGYDMSIDDKVLMLEMHWRVVEPPGRPLSLMAHLVNPSGAAVSIGDGLGYPIEQWQPGDRLIQKHRLTLPNDVTQGAYEIRTGAYWLDTMERWRFSKDDGTASDSINIAVDLDTATTRDSNETP